MIDIDGHRFAHLARVIVKQRIFEDQHRIGVFKCRSKHAGSILDRCRRQHPDAGNMGVPSLKAVRVLGCQLPPTAGRHADDHRHMELPARHVPDSGGIVHDLVERQQREIAGHDLHDREHPAHRGANAGTGKGAFGQRRVADAIGSKLLEQPLGDRVAAAIAPDVLAHQEDALIRLHRVADRAAYGFAIGELGHGRRSAPTSRNRSSTGSQVPASAKATASATSRATSSSISATSSSRNSPASSAHF